MAAENELMAAIRSKPGNLKALREARAGFKAQVGALRKQVRKPR
jgi:hypothetical protein